MNNKTLWPKAPYAWFFTSVLLFAYIISFIDRQMINFLVGPIKEDMGLSDLWISAIQGWAFVLSYIFLSIPLGRLVDKINRVKVLIGGIVIWSIATATFGLSKNSYQLILSRSIVGAGEAALTPASWSIISDLFPAERRSFPMSIYLMGPYIGGGFAYLFGAEISEIYTEPIMLFNSYQILPWQLIFLIIAIPGLLLGLFMFTLKDPERREVVKNDQVAEENIGQVFKYVWSNFSVYFPLLMGSALIVILLYGVQSWGIEFLTRVHSWERAEAGRKFGLMMLISGSIGVISGPILEKYLNKLKVNAATLIVCLISAIALTILGPYTFLILSSNMVISGLFLIMFFITLPLALFATSLQNVSPNQYRGVVSGIYVFTANIFGLGLGPMLVAFFTDIVFKNEMAIHLSMTSIFLICGPLSILIFYFGRKPFTKALTMKIS